MRSLYFVKPGQLEWREVADPRLHTGVDAIVRPIAASTCDLDPLLIQGHAPFPGPFALGHESVAEIMAVGEHVDRLQVGQQVVVCWHISCGNCQHCLGGRPNVCQAHPHGASYGTGVGDWGGMFADLVYVPYAESMLVPLPVGLAPEAAVSAGDNLAYGYELTIPFLAQNPGIPVLVMGGCGSIPLYAVAYALAGGAGTVDYVDTDLQRLAIAEGLGANPIEGLPGKSAQRYPLVVDGSIREDVLRFALRRLEPEGQCNCVGAHFRDVRMPLLAMYSLGVNFYTGRGRGLPCLHPALEFVRTGRVKPALIHSSVTPFDDMREVLLGTPLKPVFLRDTVAQAPATP